MLVKISEPELPDDPSLPAYLRDPLQSDARTIGELQSVIELAEALIEHKQRELEKEALADVEGVETDPPFLKADVHSSVGALAAPRANVREYSIR